MSEIVSWPADRSVEARANFAVGLTRNLDREEITPTLRASIASALGLAADDPSPKVRYALAEAIGCAARAPAQVILQLASDRPDIGGLVVARSPLISDHDVPALATRVDPRLLPALATRVRSDLSAQAILVQGDALVATALLLNPDVVLSGRTLEAIAELHGEHARVRELLVQRSDLPIAARYALVDRLCTVLSTSGLVTNILGNARSKTILDEAQGAALIRAANGRSAVEIDALVAQLSERVGVDALALLRALVHGENDLFASLVCRVSGIGRRRVRSVLRAGRLSVVRALLERCDLCPASSAFIASIHVSIGSVDRSPHELTGLVMRTMRADCNVTAALLGAVQRWHHGTARTAQRLAA